MINKQKVHGKSAFIEMVGSVVLLISLFLPWITLSIGGSGTFGFVTHQSYSFFEGITQLSRLGRGISDLSSIFSSDGTEIVNYANILYLIPLLCIVNPIVQYFIRLPWLSFYTAVIPTVLSFTVGVGYGYVTNELGVYSSLGGVELGAGASLTIFVGSLMIIASWSSMGWYYKEHWKFLVTATVWTIFAFMCKDSLRGMEPGTLMALAVFFVLIGFTHIPFIIYTVVVLLVSVATEPGEIGKGERSIEEHTPAHPKVETDGYMDSIRMRSDENLKEILRNREDYSERLVKAAEKVLLERLVATTEQLTPVEPEQALSDDEKYKAYQPKK